MIYIVPSVILGLATIDDLMKRKVHNWLFLFCLALAVGHTVFFHGTTGLLNSLYSGGLAFLITFPLFLIKALGGGDVKIFTALGVATSTAAVINVFLYSLLWGTLLGIGMLILNKGFKSFIQNIFAIVTLKKAPQEQLHKMPYTFALLCGWISHIIVIYYGRAL